MSNQKPLPGDLLDYGDPLSRGLVGFWPFNEDNSSDKVFDLSGSEKSGTFEGDTTWTSGKFGSATKFSGVDGGISLGTLASNGFNLQTFTKSIWIRPDVADDNPHSVFDFGSRSDINIEGLPGAIQANNEIMCAYYTGAFATLGSGVIVVPGQWYHVAFVCLEGVGHWLYVDGILRESDTNTNSTAYITSREVLIGWNYSRTAYEFIGAVDNAAIWNRALSSSEIAQLYREPFRMVRTRRRGIIYDGVAVAPPTTFPYYYREIASRRIA